jgi:hypothetical protein
VEIAKAFIKYVGDMSSVDKDVAGVPAKAEPGAKAAGGMFATHIGNGIKLGIGGLATSGLAAGLLKLSEPLEKSEATLSAAFDQTGHHIDDYKGKIAAAQDQGAKFGHGSADVNEALAKLTIGFKDPKKALEEMKAAEELAAMKHISLAEAAGVLVKVHAGSTKPLKDFGINIKDSAALLADASKADKAYTADLAAHQKAVDALSQLEARDAGVKKLSIGQQQQLAAAHKAVTDSADKLATATTAKAAAESAAHGVTKSGEQIFNKLISNYHGAEAQADTFSGKLEGAKKHVENFAAGIGAKAAPALTALGPLMMVSGALIESGALKMIGSGAKVAASWVADTAKFVVQQGIRLVSWLATNAVMVATAIATGIAAAAAFMLPLLPFILIGLAVAGLVLLVVTHFTQIKAFVTTVVGDIVGFFSGAIGKIVGFFGDMLPKVGKAILDILLFFPELELKALLFFGGLVGKIVGFFLSIPQQLLGLGKTILHTIGQAFAGAAGNVPVIGGALKSFLQSFDRGGLVGGAPGVAQLAIVHGGERVLTAAQQQGGGGSGTQIGEVHIHNPRTELDVVRVLETQQYLAQLKARGLRPAPRPALQGA